MNTIIELYDSRPIENVLSAEVFSPREVVYICPEDAGNRKGIKKQIQDYLSFRGIDTKVSFTFVSHFDAAKIEELFREVISSHPDCAIDITGGTDAALFAAGRVAGSVPVFTFSRIKNKFFNIHNAPFAEGLPCDVHLDCASSFLMAGGRLLPGREDSATMAAMKDDIDKCYTIFAAYRGIWAKQINYIQRISEGRGSSLAAQGKAILRDRPAVTADMGFLYSLAGAGLIKNLKTEDKEVSFAFKNAAVRFLLRDVGAILEARVFHACVGSGLFDDVVISAVVNWDGAESKAGVTNEIDVACVRGTKPMFISCKTGEIKTEALNELAILRDRFGGEGSRALIVTTSPATKKRALMQRRAAEMDITVIDQSVIDIPGAFEEELGKLT